MTTSAETVAVVDPRTGVAFKPDEIKDELLVEIFTELDRRERQMREWRTQAEAELVRRHGDRRAARVIGDYEVDVKRHGARQWDAEDLVATVSDLLERGLVSPVEVHGLVREEKTLKVDGHKAKALLDHSEEEVLLELSRCFTWAKRKPTVQITPVVQLEPPR